MQCDEAQNLNMDFISGSMDSKKLNEYIKHIESCKDCYEELDIMFIVTQGLEGISSDTVSSFNFPGMLSRKIGEAKLFLKIKKARDKLTTIISGIAYGLLGVVIIFFFTNV